MRQTLAGIVNYLIGLMYSLERNIILNKDSQQVDIINRARQRIRESLEMDLTIQDIAQDLGVGYSSFRKLFKEFTGLAPAQYQHDLRLQRAKELLSTTDESIKEIAKSKTTGETKHFVLQSAPASNDRSLVSIWYKLVDKPAKYSNPSIFSQGWTKGMQVSAYGSAYSTMCVQAFGSVPQRHDTVQ